MSLKNLIAEVMAEISENPMDQITTAEFVEAYSLDTEGVRAVLANITPEEIAALYAAGVHFSNGCCPKGLREANTSLGEKLMPHVAPGADARKRAISARHMEAARQRMAAASATSEAPSGDTDVDDQVAKGRVFSAVFGGGGNPGTIN